MPLYKYKELVRLKQFMRKIFLLIFVFVCVCVDTYAQMYNIYVKNSDGKPLKGVMVYTFPIKSKGEAAFQEAESNYGRFDLVRNGVIARGETQSDGLCVIEGRRSGSIILDGYNVSSGIYGIALFDIDDFIKSSVESTIVLVLKSEGSNDISMGDQVKRKESFIQQGIFNDGKATNIKEKSINAKPVLDGVGTGLAVRRNRYTVDINRPIRISGEYARNDARFVAFPWIVKDGVKETVVYSMPPTVVDGKEYKRSMNRRMSFDQSRDKLDDFHFDASLFMEDHNSEEIMYSYSVMIEKGEKWHAPGLIWYEDYNGVYYQDSILFHDGKETEPMRFLEWDAARRLVELDRTLYYKQGTYEAIPDKSSFNLRFEQGDTQLNLRDSITLAQRDSMLRWLGNYYTNKEGQIDTIIVRGYSSPEGSERKNRSLAHSRARTILSLLSSYFPDVAIKSEFNEYDNIVPWTIVADTLSLSEDSLSQTYAKEIRRIVEQNKGFDAQYSAIRANRKMYDFLDKYVLDRVRFVEIQANVIMQRILTKEEIVDRYTNDPEFRTRMLPYQYYTMISYLADKEQWEDLYYVSKSAYHKYNRERELLRVQAEKIKVDSLKKDTLIGRYIKTVVPYPLAGYYYAVASMKLGLIDKNILKPYLDDGPVAKREVMNALPFIVAQVLMYCQDEDYDGANELIKKYHLLNFSELTGLVMFVRCLNYELTDESVRNYVMTTSEMNRAVVLMAMGKYMEALKVLYGNHVPYPDDRVEYMKAVCHFRSQNSNVTSLEADGYSGSRVYSPGEYGITSSAWAAPMLNAFTLNEENVKYLESDGYFNDAYRQMMFYFWERYKNGIPVEQIVREYDALIAQMRKNKASSTIR